jgi:hypothetical protein
VSSHADKSQTTDAAAERRRLCKVYPDRAANEIEGLRALVTRLTDKLEDYTRDGDYGDSDLPATIYCGRNFIYG